MNSGKLLVTVGKCCGFFITPLVWLLAIAVVISLQLTIYSHGMYVVQPTIAVGGTSICSGFVVVCAPSPPSNCTNYTDIFIQVHVSVHSV